MRAITLGMGNHVEDTKVRKAGGRGRVQLIESTHPSGDTDNALLELRFTTSGETDETDEILSKIQRG